MSAPLLSVLNTASLFNTDRISVLNWNAIEIHPNYKDTHIESVLKILTPNVTKALPDGWQNINSVEKASKWILDRKNDSHFYAITLHTDEIIGFLFLYTEDNSKDIRLGYLLKESVWGKGLGSELIKGLVEWSKNSKAIDSISGGVEKGNIGSIKVLEKNGFYISDEEMPPGMLLYTIDF